MMPSRGISHVLKAAATNAGLATQTMNSANRGKSPANSANRQPIVRSLHRVGRTSARSVKAATRDRRRGTTRPRVTAASGSAPGNHKRLQHTINPATLANTLCKDPQGQVFHEGPELQAGADEEAGQEPGAVLHPSEPGLHQRGQLGEVVYGQV